MRCNAEPIIVWADLPTPDVVVVRHEGGAMTVIADPAVPRAIVVKVASWDVDILDASVASVALDDA